jgi:adenine phosphoribosyltransferase
LRTHAVDIAGLRRELPLVTVAPGTEIAFLKLYGDLELIDAAVEALAARLRDDIDILLGPETGGILLAHLLAQRTRLPYVVARKKVRPNMRKPLRVAVQTIGTAGHQELILGEDDTRKLRRQRVALVDEVVSTGGTVRALRSLVSAAHGSVAQVMAVATEGEAHTDVTALCHLPMFSGTLCRDPIDGS